VFECKASRWNNLVFGLLVTRIVGSRVYSAICNQVFWVQKCSGTHSNIVLSQFCIALGKCNNILISIFGQQMFGCEGNATLSLAMNFCDYHACKQVLYNVFNIHDA
jgi:hypothetical protein